MADYVKVNGERKFLYIKDRKIVLEPVSTEDQYWELFKIPNYIPKKINKQELFTKVISILKKLIVLNEEIEYKILTLWIISTWKPENWNTVGFPEFVGMYESGKTRMLETIRELGYRFVQPASCTAAVLPRLSDKYGAHLLIDEIHNIKQNPEMETFLKTSYRRGLNYLKCDSNNDKDVVIMDNFGFKAFAGEKPFIIPSIASRCIQFKVPKAIPEVEKIEYIKGEIDELFSDLFIYRLSEDKITDLGEHHQLQGRIREIFESIVVTGLNLGISVEDVVEYALSLVKKREKDLERTDEYEIIKIIAETGKTSDIIYTREIIALLYGSSSGEYEYRKDSQKLGYILRDMGIKTLGQTYSRRIEIYDEENLEIIKNRCKRYNIIWKEMI